MLVSTFANVTFALGTTAPQESETTPLTAEEEFWEKAWLEARMTANTTATDGLIKRLTLGGVQNSYLHDASEAC
jgi:hypothetical protein